MSEKAWAYYSSAADDEITNRENHLAYHRLVVRGFTFTAADHLAGYGSDLAYFATLAT